MQRQPTLPTFGALVPGEGGRLGAIMRGALVDGQREPDYALIVPANPACDMDPMPWGKYGLDVPGANSLTDGWRNTPAMLAAKCPPALRLKRLKRLEADGHRDLYIPSRAEMLALRANVPELLVDKAVYWTSTQYSRFNAFAQHFEDGFSYWSNKDNEFRVLALRRIPLQHFPT